MSENIDEILEQHGGDCPITIFRMARTRWQKAVAIEFLKQQKQITEMKNDIKWIKYLLSAMPELFRSFPHYRLVLVGEGPQYPMLRRLVNSLGIAEKVTFLGFQPQDQVRTWMQQARLLILPSLEEAQGVVLLEALACGTPVIASQVDGIPEVITPDVGILVPPANSIALFEAIRSILRSPRRWVDMSHRARERAVKYYDWDRIASQFAGLYQSMTG